MSKKIISQSESTTGDGDSRKTLNYSDGSSRDITYTKNGIVVDDHNSDGTTESGAGVRNVFQSGTNGGVSRLKNK